MAVPKSLKDLAEGKADEILSKSGGHWEGTPGYSDFIYKKSGKDWLLRKKPMNLGWETGVVSY